jgi:peptide/nickel transport system ATP-binding protein
MKAAKEPHVSDVLDVKDLRTEFRMREGIVRAVDGVSLSVPAGTTVCIVGESGCGKSVTARSILGLVEPPGRVTGGTIRWRTSQRSSDDDMIDLGRLDPRGESMRTIRGNEISMIFQEPMASLSPMYTVGEHLIEAIRLHKPVSAHEASAMAVRLLRDVGIPNAADRMHAYPFQLSGGMCQRVMIALAISCDPSLLIADEPTTALDVTTQARILDLLRRLQDESGMSMLFITHDLGVVGEIADEVVVMYLGTVVERGPVEAIFHAPKHPYTRALLASVPRLGVSQGRPRSTMRGQVPHPLDRPRGCPFHPRCDDAIKGICDVLEPPIARDDSSLVRCVLYAPEQQRQLGEISTKPPGRAVSSSVADRTRLELRPTSPISPVDLVQPPIISIRELQMDFPGRRPKLFARTTHDIHALNGIDLDVSPGEILGIVGESGCGKSTLGRCITGAQRPTAGHINVRDRTGKITDLATARRKEVQRTWQQQIRLVFQDPFSSLNPRMTVLQIIGDPLRANGLASGSELEDRVAEMLIKVGLSSGHMRRYPHAFSGGERQRINIARALIMEPRVVVADEAVSALDVSVRAQILELLADLRQQLDLTLLFISHDLSVVERLCDRVAVMYLGRIVEISDTASLYAQPLHPYTEALLSAVPDPDPRRRGLRPAVVMSDEIPDPANLPAGCYFHTRCPYVKPQCSAKSPALRLLDVDHRAACHLAEDLNLSNGQVTGKGAAR